MDCGIQQNSTLKIFVQNSLPLRLNIKIPSDRKVIVVETKSYDCIKNVKSLISAKEGIYSDDFSLIHSGKVLEDDKTLISLNITGESTLHVVTKPRNMLPISVKIPSGETLKIEMNASQKVSDIKTIVESIVGFPVDDTIITYEGRELKYSKAIYWYNLTEESVLEMSLKPQTFPVFIRRGYGKTITLDVCGESLVKDVKDKIVHRIKVPAHVLQNLVFEGKILNDARNLASYDIERDSTLILSLRPSQH